MDQGACRRGERRNLRYPTSIPASIIADRQEYAADIKDISCLGCCVSVPCGLERGDEIVVVIGGASLVATVAWSRGLLAGANFHREIEPLRFVRDFSDHKLFARRRLANTMLAMAG